MPLPGVVVLAGLGLFFYGLDTLSKALEELVGRRIRSRFAPARHSPARALLWGMLAGVLTQSWVGHTAVIVNLLAAGLVATSGVLPILLGATVGRSLLPLLFSFDLFGAALALIGLTGIALAVGPLRQHAALLRACLGIALSFYGLALIKRGVGAAVAMPWFWPFMESLGDAYIVGFVAGVVLACVLRAPIAVIILAVTLHGEAVLTLEQAAILIYGAVFGIAPVLYLQTVNVRGMARRVPVSQMVFSTAGGVLSTILFVLEVYGGVPALFALLRAIPVPTAQQAGLIAAVNAVLIAAIAAAFIEPIGRLLDRRYPATRSDAFSRLQYLKDVLVSEPDLALQLVEKEQARLLEGCGDLFEAHRAGNPQQVRAVDEAGRRLGHQIDEFLRGLGKSEIPPLLYGDLQRTLARNTHLIGLYDDVGALTAEIGDVRETALSGIAAAMIEGLDVKRMLVLDAMATHDEDDVVLAATVTRPSRGALNDIRRRYLELEITLLDAGQRLRLLRMLGCFERTDCRLHSVTQTLRPNLGNGRNHLEGMQPEDAARSV